MPTEPPRQPPPVAERGEAHTAHAVLHAGFHWHVPTHFNIAQVCCTRWAEDPQTAPRVAVVWTSESGDNGQLTYAELQARAQSLASVLQQRGARPGDRVAIVMAQGPGTAVAHMAVYMLGAVAVPLTMLFGPEALAYRLQDSSSRWALVDGASVAQVLAVRDDCAQLATVLNLDALDAARPPAAPFQPHSTTADDAALLIYTSGTTGPAKGALIPHRALLGNLSGFVCSQNWFGVDPPSVFYSPADWAWTGGLMDALLPTLYFGQRIVAYRGRFTPERTFELLQRHQVTHTFLFPTALKAMMKAVPLPHAHYGLKLQAVMSAGEAVGDAVFDWCRTALGVGVNEMFGQTEINYVVGNCASYVAKNGQRHAAWPAKPGSMGRAYPGHRVAVIDEHGIECPRGTAGDVAVHRLDVHGHPDPVFFLGYWGQPEATVAKFTGAAHNSWCRTGDMAVMDAEGYFWYQGRSDDMFKAAGYRIGPSEVENCLVKHPAVVNAAVVPKPDAERGALVKAYVVLAPGFVASTALVAALQAHVRGRLAPYEYPKEIEFVDALPMTTTGKVQRRVLRLQEEARAAAQASGTVRGTVSKA